MQNLRPEAASQSLFCFFFLANRKFFRINIPRKIDQRFLEVPPTCTEERLEGNEILKEI